jgi:hypothetical protein
MVTQIVGHCKVYNSETSFVRNNICCSVKLNGINGSFIINNMSENGLNYISRSNVQGIILLKHDGFMMAELNEVCWGCQRATMNL